MDAVRILLLEDDPLDVELISESLRGDGVDCEIHAIATQRELAESLEHPDRYQLILSDYRLPGYDGIAALEYARERCPDVPFLFVSGAIGEERAIESLKRGATDYVLKHRLDRLAPAVRRALQEIDERTERLRAVESQRESEERFRLIVENVRDHAIVLLDLDGCVADWNAASERLLGHKAEQIVGRSLEEFYPDEGRTNCEPQIELETARTLGRAEADGWLVRSNGTRFWASSVTSGLMKDGELCGFVKIIRDTTERKRLLESLQERAEQLAEADRRKDEFLAMLSHELRNPLGAILNATYILDRAEPPPETISSARDVIVRQANQMARLLDDLLDVSRVTQSKIELKREVLDLRSTIQPAVEAVQSQFDDCDIVFTLDLTHEPLHVVGDPTRLQQIQVNLLNNASKYTPAGESVCMSVCREADEAVLRVRDTGTGISPEMLDRVFDMFVQSDETLDRSQGGMGVGLTLVKSLVEIHGGTVNANSEGVGRGSEFVVRLPLVESTTEVDEAAPDAAPEETGRKVLIVEDNADAREMLQMLLELDGYIVVTEEDGLAGSRTAERERPDVAVVDIGLPKLNGYEVARRVRESVGEGIYLVALTGYGQPADRQLALDAGFNEHLVKPLQPDQLKRVLAETGT